MNRGAVPWFDLILAPASIPMVQLGCIPAGIFRRYIILLNQGASNPYGGSLDPLDKSDSLSFKILGPFDFGRRVEENKAVAKGFGRKYGYGDKIAVVS